MRVLILVLAAATPALAAVWEVSGPDSFGWRRALIANGEARLAIVCPPDRPPFAVPVVHPRPDGDDSTRVVLGLEVDGVRHDQPMLCSEVICEADLAEASWRALKTGATVTLWFDDGRGPSFPLDGSAVALEACSPHF